jgi:hypothetical protein
MAFSSASVIPRRSWSELCLPAEPEAAAEEIEDVSGATVGEGVADVVRRAFIDPHLDILDVMAERLVIRGRADRLGAPEGDTTSVGQRMRLSWSLQS